MRSVEQQEPQEEIDQAIIRLLGHRYGDGLVYLDDDGERSLFQRALRMGLVNAEGYLTAAGLAIAARYATD